MRKIKCRVWDGKKYAKQGLLVFDCDRDGNLQAYRDWRDHEDGVPIENAVIEQFTDVIDKNGKEIYEGDIVKATYGKTDFENEVLFADDSFCVRHSNDDFACCANLTEHENVEIVGNIHEQVDTEAG